VEAQWKKRIRHLINIQLPVEKSQKRATGGLTLLMTKANSGIAKGGLSSLGG
jgi:hypothetical protein